MFILRKKLSLLVSSILIYASVFYVYDYKCGLNSMNSILDTHNVYYKNRLSNTYVVITNNNLELLNKLMKYNWHVSSIYRVDKNKIILYLNHTGRETNIVEGEKFSKTNYNLIYKIE